MKVLFFTIFIMSYSLNSRANDLFNESELVIPVTESQTITRNKVFLDN